MNDILKNRLGDHIVSTRKDGSESDQGNENDRNPLTSVEDLLNFFEALT